MSAGITSYIKVDSATPFFSVRPASRFFWGGLFGASIWKEGTTFNVWTTRRTETRYLERPMESIGRGRCGRELKLDENLFGMDSRLRQKKKPSPRTPKIHSWSAKWSCSTGSLNSAMLYSGCSSLRSFQYVVSPEWETCVTMSTSRLVWPVRPRKKRSPPNCHVPKGRCHFFTEQQGRLSSLIQI